MRMKPCRVALYMALANAPGIAGLGAQGVERTPEAAVRDLEADGYVDEYGLFNFRGCPQGDPTGQAVFEAVQAVELHGHGLVSLARALAYEVYPDCDYEPLSSWIAGIFDQLHARGEVGPATSFVRGLGPRIDRRLQEALFRAAEDTEFAGEGPRLTSRVSHNLLHANGGSHGRGPLRPTGLPFRRLLFRLSRTSRVRSSWILGR